MHLRTYVYMYVYKYIVVFCFRVLFLIQEAFPNFRGWYLNFWRNCPNFCGNCPNFWGTTSIFGGAAPIFGGIAPNLEEGIENVPRGQRNSASRPMSLNLLPKTMCVITAMRQPKEVSLLSYSSTW